MDIATIIGLIMGFGAVIGGQVTELIDVPSILVTAGVSRESMVTVETAETAEVAQ